MVKKLELTFRCNRCNRVLGSYVGEDFYLVKENPEAEPGKHGIHVDTTEVMCKECFSKMQEES